MMRLFASKVVLFSAFFALTTLSQPNFAESILPSIPDEPELSSTKKDPVDGGWLPNLTGLPDLNVLMEISDPLVDVVMNEKDAQCNAIDPNLRMLIFQHFVTHQHMANAQGVYFDKKIAHRWARVLAMILKESSGDSTNITDMTGRSISTYQSKTTLGQWQKILELSKQTRIKLDYQTNFGLTQASSDRLFNAFKLAENENSHTEFLAGKEGSLSKKKVKLNTAIAIRRLVWFYQDFAQGRIKQSDARIKEADIESPEFYERYQEGLKMAVIYCGTRFMFETPQYTGKKEHELRNAISTIAYCKLGNAKSGYGKKDATCFAQWVTLCPALNIDMAILTPLSYFQTRGEKPICERTFMQLIKQREEN
jgi:hypothetical protein